MTLTFSRLTVSNARKAARAHGAAYLLTKPGQNPKTSKSAKLDGVYAIPMHLAPWTLSGRNVCSESTPGCRAACLHTAGNPAHMAGKDSARIARTRFYTAERDQFMILLIAELETLRRQAAAAGLKPAARLDATSDLGLAVRSWRGGVTSNVTLVELFPDIMFYDYTKVQNRYLRFLNGEYPPNYHLTFSAAEGNHTACETFLGAGGTVSAIFRGGLPTRWLGYPVLDGDRTDYRPSDPRGSVIGLKPKGKARHDVTGFVIDWEA